MKLRFKSQTRNKVVNMLVETVEFTEKENKVLDQVGEPIITFERRYGDNLIKFSKKLRSGFKVYVKFDGNLETSTSGGVMNDLGIYINDFKADLEEEIMKEYTKALTDYNEDLEEITNADEEVEILE